MRLLAILVRSVIGGHFDGLCASLVEVRALVLTCRVRVNRATARARLLLLQVLRVQEAAVLTRRRATAPSATLLGAGRGRSELQNERLVLTCVLTHYLSTQLE